MCAKVSCYIFWSIFKLHNANFCNTRAHNGSESENYKLDYDTVRPPKIDREIVTVGHKHTTAAAMVDHRAPGSAPVYNGLGPGPHILNAIRMSENRYLILDGRLATFFDL